MDGKVRRYLETPAPGFDQPLWTDPTKPGVVLGALPEDLDGGGAGVQDLAGAVEEASRVLHGAPLTTTLTAVRVPARYGFLHEHRRSGRCSKAGQWPLSRKTSGLI